LSAAQRGRRLAAVLLVAGGVASSPAGAAAASEQLAGVEHIVIVINEGQTFDSLLGRFPGVDGLAEGEQRDDMTAIAPILASDASAAQDAWNGGAMDGFAQAQVARGLSGEEPFVVAERNLVPSIWALAEANVVGDRAFASVLGDGPANRRVLFGYTPDPAAGSLLDALDAAGVTWSIAIEGYDPAIGLPAPGTVLDRLVALAPPLGDPSITGDPGRKARVTGLEAFYDAVETDQLPDVTWILPSGGASAVAQADSLAGAVANGIARSAAWPSTVLVVTWDSWGGRADHAPPPLRDGVPIGFRVPQLAIGSRVAAGAIDSVERSHESTVRLVEDRFGIPPRTPAEAAANSLADIVTEDGSRIPALVGPDIPRFLPGAAYRFPVLLTYLGVIVLFVLIVGAAAVVDRRLASTRREP
jgi:phospholipase C